MTDERVNLDPELLRLQRLLEMTSAEGEDADLLRARNRLVSFMQSQPAIHRRRRRGGLMVAFAVLVPTAAAALLAATILGVFRPIAFRPAPAGPTPSAEQTTPTPSPPPSASPTVAPPVLSAPGGVATTVCDWTIVPSPDPPGWPDLRNVAVVGANDVWAVGSVGNTSASSQPLAEHWDGVRWSIVPTARLGAGVTGMLIDVTGSSVSDVWAVGYDTDASNRTHTLAEHWDGATWAIKPTVDPNPAGSNGLLGIGAAGPWVRCSRSPLNKMS
jgi:hypothetical protein